MELKLDRNKTYGLALEGGGAKGAYQIGAWKALREAGIRFSAVSGTSVGALNGAMIVMDDLQKAEDVWNNIHFSQVMDVDDEEMRRLMTRDIPLSELKSTLRSVAEIIRKVEEIYSVDIETVAPLDDDRLYNFNFLKSNTLDDVLDIIEKMSGVKCRPAPAAGAE